MAALQHGDSLRTRSSRCWTLLHDVTKKLKPPKNTLKISRRVFQDEADRYKIWADNIGALKKGPKGLDSRLREAPSVVGIVLRMLADLQSALELMLHTSSASTKIATTSTSDSDSDFEGDHWSDDSDEPEVGNRDSSIMFRGTSDEVALVTVQQCITELLRLSMAIRKASKQEPFSRSSKLPDFDPSPDIEHVKQKFLKLDEGLAQRLGKANNRRRKHFSYRRDHRARLAGATDPYEEKAPSQSEYTKASTLLLARLNLDEVGDFSDDGNSVTTFNTVIGDENAIAVPPAPAASEGRKPFECPFCLQITVIGGRQSWKRHVYRDLHPYVCTFAGCEMMFFSSQREWFEHELSWHRSVRRCCFCDQSYQDRLSLSTHLNAVHREASSTLSPDDMVQSCVIVDINHTLRTCNFCDDWSAASDSRKGSPASLQSRYRKHVGKHMEQLALFSLPRNVGEKEDSSEQDSGGERTSSAESQVQSPHSELSFSPPQANNHQNAEDERDFREELGLLDTLPPDLREAAPQLNRDEQRRRTAATAATISSIASDIGISETEERNPKIDQGSDFLDALFDFSDDFDIQKRNEVRGMHESMKTPTLSTQRSGPSSSSFEARSPGRMYPGKHWQSRYPGRYPQSLLPAMHSQQTGQAEAPALAQPDRTSETRPLETADQERWKEKDDLTEEEQEAQREYEARIRAHLEESGYTSNQIDAIVDKEDLKVSKVRRRVFPKIRTSDIAMETLAHYDLQWEYDKRDPDFVVIQREMTEGETDVLFAHTERLRENLKGPDGNLQRLDEMEPRARGDIDSPHARGSADTRVGAPLLTASSSTPVMALQNPSPARAPTPPVTRQQKATSESDSGQMFAQYYQELQQTALEDLKMQKARETEPAVSHSSGRRLSRGPQDGRLGSDSDSKASPEGDGRTGSQPQDADVRLRTAESSSRPGDWTCPSCGFLNFQQRKTCDRCSLSVSDYDSSKRMARWNTASSAAWDKIP